MNKINIYTGYNPDIENASYKLAPIFAMYGWVWGDEVPNQTEISKKLNSMVKELIDSDYEWISTGRITIRKMQDGYFNYLSISLDIADIYEEE